MQFYCRTVEKNPIADAGDEYAMSKAISDGWAFTFGSETWLKYNAQRFCNIRTFPLSDFGASVTVFPFRHDFNATLRRPVIGEVVIIIFTASFRGNRHLVVSNEHL